MAISLAICGVLGDFSCAQGGDASWPTTKWHVSTLEAQGMGSDVLVMLIQQLADRQTDIDSILVVQQGDPKKPAEFSAGLDFCQSRRALLV